MTRPGAFAFGVFTGIILMQIGHALYLHSGDYLFAAVATAFAGLLVCAMVNDVSN